MRHTIGLADPLTDDDLSPEDRVRDGLPQTLAEYLERTGIAYFKIKVSNRLEHDRSRLVRLAQLIEMHRGDAYHVTLDGNEQYKSAADFDQLIDVLRSTPELATLLANTLSIEQPLDRAVALDERHTNGVRRLSVTKPVIIDESDGELNSFADACELGYRGTSSKNCKGPIKAILNAGLVWLLNGRGATTDYVITGEDLCCVGMVSVQADTCLVGRTGAWSTRNGTGTTIILG